MVRNKEDLMRGLRACTSGDCAHCQYGDIGCSPPLAADALALLEEQEQIIIYLKKLITRISEIKKEE